MSRKDIVKVRIFDYPPLTTGWPCCDRSSTFDFEHDVTLQKSDELRDALEKAYPGQISFEYIDMLLWPDEKLSDPGRLLITGQCRAPLVVIDGVPSFAGEIVIDRIVDTVGKILSS